MDDALEFCFFSKGLSKFMNLYVFKNNANRALLTKSIFVRLYKFQMNFSTTGNTLSTLHFNESISIILNNCRGRYSPGARRVSVADGPPRLHQGFSDVFWPAESEFRGCFPGKWSGKFLRPLIRNILENFGFPL